MTKKIEEKTKNKYIICDMAERNWGKTTTLKKVITEMDADPFFKLDKSMSAMGGKRSIDKRVHYKCVGNNKRVVVSTIGDNIPKFVSWLNKASSYPADVIVTACHPADQTLYEIFNLAKNFGYELIWFKNFRFDNKVLLGGSEYKKIKDIESKSIVEIVKSLL